MNKDEIRKLGADIYFRDTKPKAQVIINNKKEIIQIISIEPSTNCIEFEFNNKLMHLHLKYVKPYLFPLSSMTKEQREEYDKLLEKGKREAERRNSHYGYKWVVRDFLVDNYFDKYNLIEKGLALDATGLNIY